MEKVAGAESLRLLQENFNYDDKELTILSSKHQMALSLMSANGLKGKILYLKSKGIIPHLNQTLVFCRDFEEIKTIVEEYEKNGELSALIQNPLATLYDLKRILWMKENNIPYKDGIKYSSIPLSRTAFYKKYPEAVIDKNEMLNIEDDETLNIGEETVTVSSQSEIEQTSNDLKDIFSKTLEAGFDDNEYSNYLELKNKLEKLKEITCEEATNNLQKLAYEDPNSKMVNDYLSLYQNEFEEENQRRTA